MSFSFTLPTKINDANIVENNLIDEVLPQFNLTTTYGLGVKVAIDQVDMHYVYESLKSGNLGNDPRKDDLLKPLNWLRVSSTNKYKMFDSVLLSQAEANDFIDVTFKDLKAINAIWIGNVFADSVEITITQSGSVIFFKSYSLIRSGKIQSHFSWYFDERNQKSSLLIDDIPISYNAVLRVKIIGDGLKVKCGSIAPGTIRYFGEVEYGAKFGIDDFTDKRAVQYGDVVLREGAYRKFIDLTVWVDSELTDNLNNILVEYRAKYLIFSGSNQYEALQAFGFFESYFGDVRFHNKTIFSISIKGIT